MRAVARPLGQAFDLLATYHGPGDFFFERAGLGVSATGVAARVSAPLHELADAVQAALADVSIDPGGPRPVAVGALPFDPQAEGSLTIAARTTGRNPTGAWQLEIGDEPTHPNPTAVRWSGRSMPHEPFGELQLVERPSASQYAGLVEAARTHIRAGALDKVVLARTLEVDAGRMLDAKQLLWRLRAAEPTGYVFAAPAAGGALVGASPELLAEVSGRTLSVNPLAGSAPRHGDPAQDRAAADQLMASAKDRYEHDVVVRAVAAALAPLCEELDHPNEPELHATANVWHLATPFRGTLRSDVTSVLTVVAGLHPTPAVGGHPQATALATLRELEPFDRGSYAGPVGWVDAHGDGVWAIALRCAQLDGEHARLFAGAGIVGESDPAAEVEETDRKFRAFLDSLRWG
ncbi:MAG: isochorismate synthase [Actinomycetota bacterium]|nr:isochorismate synthase [Actinomycetota bacterium]